MVSTKTAAKPGLTEVPGPGSIYYPFFYYPHPLHNMKFSKCIVLLLALTIIALFVAGCTTTTTIGNPASATPAATVVPAAPAATAAPAAPAATTAAPAAATPAPSTTPACPDKEILTGSWDSREVGYASNHDVREAGVWEDAGPVPVTLTETCWDAAGTFKTGDCSGKLSGKLEKTALGAFVYSGTYTSDCTTGADSSTGTFSVTMAADNQSFMGSMYKNCEGCYGPENGFPPSWWAKKTA